jgi:hypothetical protein
MRQHSISSLAKYFVAVLVTGLLVVSMADSAYAGKGAAAGSGVNTGVSGSYNGRPVRDHRGDPPPGPTCTQHAGHTNCPNGGLNFGGNARDHR